MKFIKIVFISAFMFFSFCGYTLAQEANRLTELRHKAMDEEVSKLIALREKAMDEAVHKLLAKKDKPRFFFTLLQPRLKKPLQITRTTT